VSEAPSPRACILALNSWADDWSDPSRYDRYIFELDLTGPECDAYRLGAEQIAQLDPRPGRFEEDALSSEAVFSFGLAVVLFGHAAMQYHDEEPGPALPVLKLAGELASILEVRLDRSQSHDTLRRRLQGLLDSLRPLGALSGAAPRRRTEPGTAAPKARRSVPSIDKRWLVAVGLILAVGALRLGLRTIEEPAPAGASDFADVLPVQTLVYAPGHVTARLPPDWGHATSGADEEAAAALWRRVATETDDPGVRLTLADSRGTPVANVVDGRVRWVQ